jgi:sugar lactone lactonase YvrE
LGIEIREPEFAVLDVSSNIKPAIPKTGTVALAKGAEVKKLAGGFLNIAGAAVNSKGKLYFSDARELKIYRWSQENGKAEVVREIPEQPMLLAFDKADNLIVVAYQGNGTVFAFDPEDTRSEIKRLEPQPTQPRQNMVAYLPINRWWWTDEEAFIKRQMRKKEFHYISSDGTTFIPASSSFTTGATSWGIKTAELIRAFTIAKVMPDQTFYVTNEADLKTFAFTVGSDGTLYDGKLFVDEGGENIAVDDQGNVYLTAGHILVFDPSGKQIDTIRVPQRPISIVFGGKDKKTLFITARSSLYSVRTKFAGQW